MVFSSIIFLYYFLPLVLLVYHLLFLPVTLGWRPSLWRRLSNLFLLFVSLAFYFWGENFLIWIVVTSTMIDYIAGLLISRGFIPGPITTLKEGGPRSGWQHFSGLHRAAIYRDSSVYSTSNSVYQNQDRYGLGKMQLHGYSHQDDGCIDSQDRRRGCPTGIDIQRLFFDRTDSFLRPVILGNHARPP
ncbi:MAG: hypothetical protein DRJ61_01365 [Acidobacteria bacterium]|nr:MAG: hypothetical protein DRJ61_01365 [Acidobacteriota bacterium]